MRFNRHSAPNFCILNGDDVHTSRIELRKPVASFTLPRDNALLGNSSHHFTGGESMNPSILTFAPASTANTSVLPFVVNV